MVYITTTNINIKNNTSFLKNTFRKYYFSSNNKIDIKSPEKREFGFLQFDQRIIRHLSFSDIGELQAYLIKEVPMDIYCSNAYYRFPTFPMNAKEWQGAELIFDIDVKDLKLSCEIEHTYFLCANCNIVSDKYTNICPKCGIGKMKSINLICQNCIKSLRFEVKKLISVLIEDFGISKDKIEVYFSGNTGFHIYVYDSAFNSLNSTSRSDISGYLLGKDLLPQLLGIRIKNGEVYTKIPYFGFEYGWRKKLINEFKIDNITNQKLSNLIDKSGGYDTFKVLLTKKILEIGVKIDPMVTMDIHRIFRMPGSINSKAGLIKVKCDNIDTFDPMTESCLFDETSITVFNKIRLKFKMKNKRYNLETKRVRLPAYVAAFLVCKGFADVVY